MNKQPFYLVDAFASAPFTGNPAAVCPLKEWPEDTLLQAMAIEHNQSETAFLVRFPDHSYELRWFTVSQGEIDLCGHATLAAAHVIFEHLGHTGDEIVFHTRFSGELRVVRKEGWLTLDFPVWMPEPVALHDAATAALGFTPLECHEKRDYLFLFATESQVRDFKPDFAKLAALGKRVCITAPGDVVDFVSRFFCPGDAQDEDAVTGSAHSMLIPFWHARLGKPDMVARQLSARGGELLCALHDDRVYIGGQARTYMVGEITL